MVERILSIVLPLFAVVAVGFLYGRRHRPDLGAATHVNMDIFVPALVFSALASRDSDLSAYGPLALAGLLLVLASGLLAWPIGRAAGVAARTFVPPMMFVNAFAERFGQEPERVASIVLLGNAAALLTLPAVLVLVL